MTPEQALQNLDNAAKIVNTTRDGHDVLRDSVKMLADFIRDNKDKEK